MTDLGVVLVWLGVLIVLLGAGKAAMLRKYPESVSTSDERAALEDRYHRLKNSQPRWLRWTRFAREDGRFVDLRAIRMQMAIAKVSQWPVTYWRFLRRAGYVIVVAGIVLLRAGGRFG